MHSVCFSESQTLQIHENQMYIIYNVYCSVYLAMPSN